MYFKNQGNHIPIIHKCKYDRIIRIHKLVQIKRQHADYYNVIQSRKTVPNAEDDVEN